MSLIVIIISITSPSLSSASSPASSPSSSLALRMIFGTWRSYFISWQIFENKLWCPVSKKIRRYFHFLLSLAYPIDRPDWALFSVVILFCCWRKLKFGPLFCPATSPRFWSFLRGGEPPPPHSAGRGGEPPLPRGAGRPSLPNTTSQPIAELLFSTSYILLLNYKQISNHLKSARINFSSSTLCRHTGGRLTGRRLLIDGLRLQVDLHFCTFALLHCGHTHTNTLSKWSWTHSRTRVYTAALVSL